jgi:hypothetical protein
MVTGKVFIFMFLFFNDGQYVHTVDPMPTVQACEVEERRRVEKFKVDDSLRSVTISCFNVAEPGEPA